jgi:hypothetical protein
VTSHASNPTPGERAAGSGNFCPAKVNPTPLMLTMTLYLALALYPLSLVLIVGLVEKHTSSIRQPAL